jgi:alpha-1,2-mannosyltransferase
LPSQRGWRLSAFDLCLCLRLYDQKQTVLTLEIAPFSRFAPRVKSAFAEARWLSTTRVRGYTRLLLALNVIIVGSWAIAALAHGAIDPLGKALGTDFNGFWAASKLVLSGHAAWAYDPVRDYAEQKAAFGGGDIGFLPFFYPPPFLLICLPLALAPYSVALGAWLTVTGYACWRALRVTLNEPGLTVAMLAFPAVLINVIHGQNAFLTIALFAAGLLTLDRRPWLAGLAFGALVCKPQLAIMLPIMLVAGKRWQTIISAGATALILCLTTTLLFGAEIWHAFLTNAAFGRTMLEELVDYAKLQSVFAAVRLVGGGIHLAYGVQGISAILSIGTLVWIGWHTRDSDTMGAATAAATILASPYLFDYDLMLLAIPIAYLYRRSCVTGFLPGEKFLVACAYTLPLIARPIATYAHVPLTPLVAVALLTSLLRRSALRSHSEKRETWHRDLVEGAKPAKPDAKPAPSRYS